MSEDRRSNMVIKLYFDRSRLARQGHTIEEVGKTFVTVESMIKGVFPRLLNVKDGKVVQAKNYAHEFHLKLGKVPVKHRVRRVPVHLRGELKASIDSMLARDFEGLFGHQN